MATQNKVRYEEMLPHEIVAARREFPVAYLPLGGVEWHGEHLAVGNDTLKAHALCEIAAQKGGGLAMPALYWGEPRDGEILESSHDPDGRVAAAMGLDKSNFAPGYMGTSLEEQQEQYVKLLIHIFREIESLGFKAVLCITGHYPLIRHAREACSRYEKTGKMKAFAAIGYDLAEDLGYRGDHAAKWETSLLMALRPELVDMSRLSRCPKEPPLGVIGEDPRTGASEEFGKKAVDAVTDRMVEKARELLGLKPTD